MKIAPLLGRLLHHRKLSRDPEIWQEKSEGAIELSRPRLFASSEFSVR
jgi:hypothetical protein